MENSFWIDFRYIQSKHLSILDYYANYKFSGVYRIRNIVSNKVYIGSTIKQLRKRKSVHFHLLRNNKHENRKLQNSYNKYGEEAFIFEIIEVCDKEIIVEREQHYMDLFDSINLGYNIFPIARSGAGITLSKEHRLKIATANTGKKFTKERKLNMSKARTGRVASEEERANISKAKLGEENPMAKLNWVKVAEIRQIYKETKGIKALSIQFGVSTSTIEGIVYNKTWKI